MIPKDREDKVVSYVRQSFDMVDMGMTNKTEAWKRVEERYRAFVNPVEANLQSNKLVYPWDETVVIPYSYALLQAIVAYEYTLFTAQSPLKQITDAHGDNAMGADAMELLIAHFDRLNKSNLLLYGLLNDAAKYGIGAIKTIWDERWETRTRKVQTPVTLAGMTLGMSTETVKGITKTYDGPWSTLCDPWLIAFDPRVPAWDFQRGNFVGETIFTSWYTLKEHEEPYGPYVNLDKVPKWSYKDAFAIARQSNRLNALGLPNFYDSFSNENDRGFVMLEQLWAKITPSDLDLGPGKRPELWLFTLANHETLIQGEPVDLPHGRFPYACIESSTDMHSPLNPGIMEILTGLQDFMDWLFNSHMENVRKSLNDMFVVDPERVFINDLLNPAPFKVIRLRPEFFGTDVKQAVNQLQVQDVTQSHLQDVSMIFDTMQRISGALDALMGVPSARRRTATESSGTMQLAANKLKVQAQLISAMGLTEWGRQQAELIQGLMTEPEFVQIIGQRKSERYRAMSEGQIIKVNPDDIQGEWNFPIHDGSMPLDPIRMSETWEKMIASAAQIPEVAAQYDLGKMFARGLRSVGVRDTDDLKRVTPLVMPDQGVADAQKRGQLVPQGAGGNGGPPGRVGIGGGPVPGMR